MGEGKYTAVHGECFECQQRYEDMMRTAIAERKRKANAESNEKLNPTTFPVDAVDAASPSPTVRS
jgi:hypothetical protein